MVKNLNPSRATRELGRSFVYAFEGLLYTMHTQRNMRFHIFMAILILAFNVSFNIPVYERALLLIVICLVPAFEIINTSIEAQADHAAGPDRHELIKRAKDTAAAAVLVVSLTAMAVGGYVLLPRFYHFFKTPPTPGRITSVGLRLIMSVSVGGSILFFWMSRSIKQLFFPMLAAASMAAGGTTAVLCIIGRDPSTAACAGATRSFSGCTNCWAASPTPAASRWTCRRTPSASRTRWRCSPSSTRSSASRRPPRSAPCRPSKRAFCR